MVFYISMVRLVPGVPVAASLKTKAPLAPVCLHFYMESRCILTVIV